MQCKKAQKLRDVQGRISRGFWKWRALYSRHCRVLVHSDTGGLQEFRDGWGSGGFGVLTRVDFRASMI